MADSAEQDLRGFWTLASWHILSRDGSVRDYAEEPIAGFLHYGEQDLMAVSIFTRQRPQLLSSYGGRYRCEGKSVIHEAIEGYSPFGLKDKKVRHLHFSDDKQALRMETDWLEKASESFRYQLIWNKQAGAAAPLA